MKNIYIKLLDEGANVYRPVPAFEIETGIYEVQGYDVYDPEDEIWEYPPGSRVVVEERLLEGETVLMGIRLINKS